ncbi:acyl-CoA-binding domain-containing protein 3-like isoform X1 [Cucurbita moschata]|uniref:Acyl-CoA-binding domain-containing protein 3-like isoform X1 n=1 Tax=Cucurbita moschata TaxID=3662 RepID=A0A6J1GF87_CUCMO|nr:acyl-CoA-binding domain-containing protein 3-like isoform X1 [Cucurbita moschata]
MEFFLELALTISLPLLISFVVSKFLSRASTDEELAPFGFDLGFRSRIRNLESDKPSVVVEDFVGADENAECELKQGNLTGILESRDETESKCECVLIDSVRIVEDRLESDSDNTGGDCGGEVAGKVIDESSVRTRCEETGIGPDEEDVCKDDGVEAFENDRNKESGGVSEGGSAEEIAVEDDDWEGIERTELEKLFETAVEFVKIRDIEDPKFGGELKMRLNGLHKIAIEGPCREPPPMALKISARAKWNAWKQLGNMTPEVAMESYINLVSKNIPGWKPKMPPVNSDQNASRSHEYEKLGSEAVQL